MERLEQVADELVASGAESGLQVAVRRDGVPVAEVAAGIGPDALVHTFSMGKALIAAVVHVLVHHGAFGYDTPLAALWPAFGRHGKDTVTIGHVLTHAAGVPAVPPQTRPEDLCDWDGMCARLADAEPWWPAGERTGYHGLAFGFLAGEAVRRAAAAPVSQVLRELVAAPLGLEEELWFGLPPDRHRRLAPLVDGFDNGPPDDAPPLRIMPRALLPTAAFGNRPDILAADIPSGGTMTARAAARLYAALLDGSLIPPEQLAEIAAVRVAGTDAVFGNPARWGLGFAIGRPGADTADAFGMAGAGGSWGWVDLPTRTAVAVVKTRLSPDFATASRVAAIVHD
ncbi:serine hydrolase domain-containing protein [Dactylosporangium sucinum]|uniref:Esterase n=1 Tax=Dactylosporangium sucinum TaxID=1424081 RepID=A0A917U625_9ACTN|nr:serine hydrolase domain-containing protein [Dactylosporangium sucinum]GGM61573.1 esterase [Dactylosporangium sucinum]